MHALGIYTGADLRKFSQPELRLHFGKAGPLFYNFARGVDNRPVEAYRIRKSVGCERTLKEDISTDDDIRRMLQSVVEELSVRLARKNFKGNTLTLKLRYTDFTNISRSISGIEDDYSPEALMPHALQLLEKARIEKPIRLIGLTLSSSTKTESSGDSRQLLLDI